MPFSCVAWPSASLLYLCRSIFGYFKSKQWVFLPSRTHIHASRKTRNLPYKPIELIIKLHTILSVVHEFVCLPYVSLTESVWVRASHFTTHFMVLKRNEIKSIRRQSIICLLPMVIAFLLVSGFLCFSIRMSIRKWSDAQLNTTTMKQHAIHTHYTGDPSNLCMGHRHMKTASDGKILPETAAWNGPSYNQGLVSSVSSS